MDYELLDSGEGQKLEKYGGFVLVRPDPQAVWPKGLPDSEWQKADARFDSGWQRKREMKDIWAVNVSDLKFEVSLKNFKHTGVFPEHAENWKMIESVSGEEPNKLRVLNLFGYTGGATLAAARSGFEVVHVDASKPAVAAANENARLDGLHNAPIRWILDDARKFVAREIKRGIKYHGVVMDPPSFGRGAKGEVWKIEEDLLPLLQSVKKILAPDFKFIILNGYASGYTALAYAQLLSSVFGFELAQVERGELSLRESSPRGFLLPAGIYARWKI